MTRLRLVFLGPPDFAVPCLGALATAGHEIACVYSQPPRPAGRGRRERPSAVQALSRERGWPVRTPVSLKEPEAQRDFAGLGADAAVVVAYGLILPKPVLEAPRLGCLNLHASLLPRWRGAAPIQRAILAGDRETGVTIMRLDEGLDTGPTLLRAAVPIGPAATAESLHDELAELGARLIVQALDGLAEGTLEATPQAAAGATYAEKLTRAEGRLDWRRPAAELERRVRALNPWPGAFVALPEGGARLKVLAAERAATPAAAPDGTPPGTLLDETLTVACGSGALRLLRVQRPGKAALDAAAFLRGARLAPGTLLPSPEPEPGG